MEKTGIRANPIYYYSVLIALIIELISLCIIGWNPLFAYGLALGTCIAIVNYSIHAISIELSFAFRRGFSLTMVGYVLRLIIYGGCFLVSYKTGTISGIATLFGYVTVKSAIIYLFALKPGFSSKRYDPNKLNDLDQDKWSGEDKNENGHLGLYHKLTFFF
ncbi:MAG TPA: ATP synthase subunit I [Anaerovoracaceae bacterium]|nr:ATP synthase subunit I [Anaerovoracaceae bacterium]